MKVIDILNHLDSVFPFENACGFDNVGLLLGNKNSEITKALISLDCDDIAVKKALEEKAELIITHHPVIFSGLKRITENENVFKLIQNNISVISLHTNLDFSVGGVNTCLANALSIQNIEYITLDDKVVLQKGNISPISADAFAKRLKATLGGNIKYVDGGKQISSVLICSGSGGEFLDVAINKNIDAFVTSEIKHHLFLEAKHSEISLFDAGHFNTEDVVIEPLKELLQNKFKDISFITNHNSAIKCI